MVKAILEMDYMIRGRDEESEEFPTVQEAKEWVRRQFFGRWGHSLKAARIHEQPAGPGYWVVRPVPFYNGHYPAEIRELYCEYPR